MIARKITIWIRGEDEAAAENAFDEAVVRLLDGNIVGDDVNDNSAFYFRNEVCPSGEVPGMGLPPYQED